MHAYVLHTQELGELLLVIGGGIQLAGRDGSIGCQDNGWLVSGVKKRCSQGDGLMHRMSAHRARMSADRREIRVEDPRARARITRAGRPRVSSHGKEGRRQMERELLRLRERWRK